MTGSLVWWWGRARKKTRLTCVHMAHFGVL